MAGKKIVADLVEQALKLVMGESDNVTRLSDVKSARERDALIKQIKSTTNLVKSGYFQAGRQALINQKSLDLHKSGMLPLQQGTIVTPPSTWDMPGDWRVSGYWYDEKYPRRFGYKIQNESGQTYDAVASDPRAGLRHNNPYNFGGGFKAYAGPNAAPPKPIVSPVEKPAIAPRPPEVLDAINKEYEDLFGNEDLFKPKAHGGRTGYGPGGVIDDIVKMAGKIVSGADEPAKTGIRAYQGSPHDFAAERLVRFPDKTEQYIVGTPDVLPDVPEGAEVIQDFPLGRMRMDKIGTGEGAQAYGHGLYTAENEPVAKGYKNALSETVKVPDETPFIEKRLAQGALTFGGNTPEGAIAWLDKYKNGAQHIVPALTPELAAIVRSKFASGEFRPGGHMYEVNIAADPNAFLDWDKPLSEQPESVLSVARTFFSEGIPERNKYNETLKGSDLYDMLVQRAGGIMHSPKLDKAGIPSSLPGGTKERMGLYLSNQGIPGIKYLDAGSRGAGEGTRNYVVFDDRLISIIRKYGIAGASAMLGYNLMDGLDSKQALAATMADQDYQNASGQGEPRVAKGGGGAALEKALEKALLVAREGIEGLAKSKGKTPQELLGGFANQKPRVPFEEWRYEFEPTADLLQSKEFSPESLKPGDVIIPLIGDRTSTGRKITSIAGQPLETPAITEGGPDYMRGPSQQADKSVWASGKGVISQLEGRIQNALRASEAKGYKDPSVYGSYVAMGPQSGDFSTHTAEAVMGMLPGSKIKRADVKEFDAKMRERFADWPGLKSTKAADYVINANAGEHRKAFLDVMDSAYWRDKGFPDVSLARYATTTPELVSAPTEAAGYNIARITPSQKPELITQIHRSYPSTMHGEYVGGLPAGMTRDELFTQFSRGFDADPPARNYVMAKRRSFGMDPNAFQVMDEPEIQALIDKVERIKRGYEQGGEVYEDDDINDALRIAKDNGGSTGSVFMTDAKGINYDINGNIIPPEVTGPNPARSEATPEQVGQRAAQDPATFDALMQKYAVPDQDIARYEATKAAVAKQPYETQQMTHVGAPPMRDVKVDMPLLGGEKKITQAPYNVAGPMSMAAQAAYDLKTVPLYFTPFTAPIGAGLDVGEGVATGDPLQASLAALGAPGKYAKAAIIGGSNYLMSPAEAQAGPARWFSKAMEVANAIPMNNMTGEQALAMLRKGTSPEELKWTGTDVFLQGKPQVTKQELVDYLNKNRVQTTDVVLGGGKPTNIYDVVPSKALEEKYYPQISEIDQKILELKEKKENSYNVSFDDPDYVSEYNYDNQINELLNDRHEIEVRIRDEAIQEMGGLARPTKYGPDSSHGETLTTPGGKNYSENLYALPQKDIYTPFVEQMRKDAWEMNFSEAMKEGFGEERAKNFADKFNDIPPDKLAKFLGKEDELKSVYEAQKSFEPQYKGGHWSDVSPDVLFHTRTSELIYEPPGANRPYRVHSVEEAQSDPGQAGRKRGFKDQKAMAEVARLRQQTQELKAKVKSEQARLYAEHQERIAPYVEERVRYERELRDKYKKGEISLGDMNRLAEAYGGPEPKLTGKYRADTYQTLNPILDQIKANEAEIERIGSKIGEIPMMPFISSTEAWTDRAIKHELDKAFDNGSDYFSWTPGEAQAERYDLSRHIGKIDYNPDDGSLIAYNPEGKMVINTSVNDPSELDEEVGEELAKKLRAEENSRRNSLNDAMSVERDDDGQWGVFMYGEQMHDDFGDVLQFDSRGEAKDYLNEMMANEFANQPVTLSGLDIKTGGEGMVGYYDKIFLKRVQDVIKKATGIKPQIEVIEVQTANGPRKQLGIRLTDEMREKARFSDFNKGGRVTGGNTYDNDSSVAHALALTSEY